MSVEFGIPESEMRKLRTELERKKKYSKQTLPECCNHAAQNLGFKALEQTDVANKAEIEKVLGQVGTKVSVSKKTGKFKKGSRIIAEDSYAARIINSVRKSRGEELIFGSKMTTAVRKFIGYKVRAVGFVKSGWIKSIQDIASKTGTRLRTNFSNAKQFGKPKGYGVPAQEGLRPEAVIVNTATNDSPKAATVANSGLSKAVPYVIADLQKYTERKMQEAMDK